MSVPAPASRQLPALGSPVRPERLKLKTEKRFSPSSAPERSGPETHNVRSGLLPFVRENLGQRTNTIFDLAPPTSKKCAYLCGSGTKVYWDNMSGSISHTFHASDGIDVPSKLRKWTPPEFKSHLSMVLAWCYFDYLALDDIKHLFEQLNKYFTKGSRLYFLIQHSPLIPPTAPIFELELDDILRYSSEPPSLEAPRYAPKQLESILPGFEIEKLYLMSNGLQEHLFYKKI